MRRSLSVSTELDPGYVTALSSECGCEGVRNSRKAEARKLQVSFLVSFIPERLFACSVSRLLETQCAAPSMRCADSKTTLDRAVEFVSAKKDDWVHHEVSNSCRSSRWSASAKLHTGSVMRSVVCNARIVLLHPRSCRWQLFAYCEPGIYGRHPRWLVDMAVGLERQSIKPPLIFFPPRFVPSMNLSDTEAQRRLLVHLKPTANWKNGKCQRAADNRDREYLPNSSARLHDKRIDRAAAALMICT